MALVPAERPSRRWADLRLRIASALVLVPLGLVLLWLGALPWLALVLAGALIGALEWATLCRLPVETKVLLAVLVLSPPLLAADGRMLAALILPPSGAIVLGLLAGSRSAETRPLMAERGWLAAVGVLALGLAAVALVWLRQDGGVASVLFLLLVVWAADIGAYVVGRAVGGPRLAPSISPGKTWSGAVGGVAAAILVGAAYALVLGRNPAPALLVAPLLAVVSQLGDLAESMVKRLAGVKDSGSLIPGHGGLLDRLDGLLAAAPVAALLHWWPHLAWVGRAAWR